MAMDERPSIFMALDGPHLDGLNGSAGILRFDWPAREFHIRHYEGISAAYNIPLAPNGALAANTHHLLYPDNERSIGAEPSRITATGSTWTG